MIRRLLRVFRRTTSERGANQSEVTMSGLALSLGGIVSLVFANAVLDTGPLADEPTAQNASFTFGARGDCDPADASLAEEYENGQIPTDVLCELHEPGHYLRADAAVAFLEMNDAYTEHFGREMCITGGYRTLADQQRLYQEYLAGRNALAARPGTSNHGWGLAVDLCDGVNNFGTEQHEWMRANSQRFNWFHPEWAQQGRSSSEAWHWEYDEDGADVVAV